MNILIIPSWYPDKKNTDWGFSKIYGSFFLEQAEELNKIENVQVVYIRIHSLRRFKFKNLRNFFSFTNEVEEGLRTIRLNTFNFIPGSTFGLAAQYKIWSRLLFFVLKFSKNFNTPDIIHCHSPFFGGLVAEYAARIFKKNLVFTEHSRNHSKYLLSYENKIYQSIVDRSSKVIALSKDFKNFLYEDNKLDESKIVLIPNMLPRVFVERSRLDVQKNKEFSFIFVGMLIEPKRPLDLIKAYSLIDQKKFNCRLKIVGEGFLRDECQRFISDNNLDKKVKLLGALSRSDTLKEISQSNCLCSVSETESFGMTIIEAQALGLPVIATKSGGPQDLIDTDNGLLVEVGDISGIHRAMIDILDQKIKFDSTKIILNVYEKFHPEVVCKKLINLYKNLI